jgi:four helix bundle protein
MRDFRKYDIWKEGLDLSQAIYLLTGSFPKEELFGLSSQMRRASVSIPSNIAEGASRSTEAAFSHFIEISIGSAFELETQLELSKRVNYISSEKLAELLEPLQVLQRKLNAFRNKLKLSTANSQQPTANS